jgi:uncharacterized membrane protein
MVYLPPVPSWNALHPLIVHFPIALLFVAPLFVLLGVIFAPPKGRPFLVSALIVMALGTVSLFVAVETGEAASELVSSTAPARDVLRQQQDLAGTTEVLFALLTLVFAALLYMPSLLRRELGPRVNVALLAAYLLFYATGMLFLVNTAYRGGRLAHELGQKAPVASSAVTTDVLPPGTLDD